MQEAFHHNPWVINEAIDMPDALCLVWHLEAGVSVLSSWLIT